MKGLVLLSHFSIFALICLVFSPQIVAQNNARMLGPPNAQTGTTYTFVAADSTRVVTFNNASPVAVTLPNGATAGFGGGTMLSVVNLGAGQVTITCSSCTITANGVAAATLPLSQGQGADIYGGAGSPAVNYIALPSPTGGGPFSVSNLTVSGTGTFANTGIYTTGQMNNNFDFLLNSVSPLTEYQFFQGGTHFSSDALVVGMAIPNTATTLTANGLAVYLNNSAPLASLAAANGIYAQCRTLAATAKCEGINSLVSDGVGQASPSLIGSEIDSNINNVGTFGSGLFFGAVFNAQSTNFPVVHVGVPTGGNKWPSGLVFDSGAILSTGTAIQVPDGLSVFGGATTVGVNTGEISLFNGKNLKTANNVNNGSYSLIGGNASNQVVLDAGGNGVLGFGLVGAIHPTAAGAQDLGTNALPFGNIFLGTAATNNFKFQPAATAAARTVSMPDPLANVSLGFSYNATNPVYQSKRAVAGCTTGAAAGNSCASDITVTWGTAFGDANYSVTCTGSTPTNVPSAPFVVSASKLAASVHINYFAITAAAASYATIDCIAVHD